IATKPGSATRPIPGVAAEIVDRNGNALAANQGGLLVVQKPWPAMLRTIYGDDARYQQQYWSNVPHPYFTADGSRQDADGYLWIMGRVDDVLNVSGHRLSTMEVESALVHHPKVAEAAVVGKPDDIKGEGISCFVTLKAGFAASDELKKELQGHVVKEIGALARPDEIRFTDTLPKTRSGKIMRRLLLDIVMVGWHPVDKKVQSGNGRSYATTTKIGKFSYLNVFGNKPGQGDVDLSKEGSYETWAKSPNRSCIIFRYECGGDGLRVWTV